LKDCCCAYLLTLLLLLPCIAATTTHIAAIKIYHPNHPKNNDMPYSWDNYYKANGDDHGCRKNETIYDNVCPSEEPDTAFYDNVVSLIATLVVHFDHH
jgi:hypothetical protein